jgi:hypothetical protein
VADASHYHIRRHLRKLIVAHGANDIGSRFNRSFLKVVDAAGLLFRIQAKLERLVLSCNARLEMSVSRCTIAAAAAYHFNWKDRKADLRDICSCCTLEPGYTGFGKVG